jgi:hypothetical protein
MKISELLYVDSLKHFVLITIRYESMYAETLSLYSVILSLL